ncbi:MAG: hypothetical protein JWO26_526 [Rhodospirillales bacterium]|jgi:hypothetical protein|nr:hypothetical protein [Rhodospirillales bacterium]MDB5380894.1 hypothetical protein [Rhodospirillales bacterium]
MLKLEAREKVTYAAYRLDDPGVFRMGGKLAPQTSNQVVEAPIIRIVGATEHGLRQQLSLDGDPLVQDKGQQQVELSGGK